MTSSLVLVKSEGNSLSHSTVTFVLSMVIVFIEVLMVTLVIHSLLSIRGKRERLEKLNMLIGVFFSEVGTRLLVLFSDSDPNLDKINVAF